MTDEAKRSVADGMEGWVIVPTEPTIAMIEAWEAAIPSDDDEKWAAENQTSELDSLECTYARTNYRSFLGAAPAHPASEAVARLVEALKRIASDHTHSSIPGGHMWSAECDACHRQKIARAALAPFRPKESNPHG